MTLLLVKINGTDNTEQLVDKPDHLVDMPGRCRLQLRQGPASGLRLQLRNLQANTWPANTQVRVSAKHCLIVHESCDSPMHYHMASQHLGVYISHESGCVVVHVYCVTCSNNWPANAQVFTAALQ